MDWLGQLHILWEVALAMLLGGIIGIEREIADKPAGFRTNMLVAGAAALLVGLGDALIVRFLPDANSGLSIHSDPVRIVEAIVTGIAFLGAGTIFRRSSSEQVEGLTTGATILFSGAIGICVALRQFVLAVGVVILTLLVLRGIGLVQKKLSKKKEVSPLAS